MNSRFALGPTSRAGASGAGMPAGEAHGHSTEARRLTALADYAILDTAPEEGFDDIVAIASQICGAPMATLSPVESHGHWFEAVPGMSAEQVAALEALSRQVVVLLELRRVSGELAGALRTVRTLGQLLPICSHCKRIRDDKAYWQEVEQYLITQVGASFSHAVCPECEALHYPSGAVPAGSGAEAGQHAESGETPLL
jgi:hypothetical protein